MQDKKVWGASTFLESRKPTRNFMELKINKDKHIAKS